MKRLNHSELERYTRQITLPEMGECRQQRLKESSALIVGVGGLGSPIATLLTTSGFGRIGIVDSDVVSLSNLPRQTLYTTLDIGEPKVECAKRRLSEMNPEVEIESYNQRLDTSSALEIASKYDMIIDACDNATTRYIMDNISKELSIPYIYGAISGFVGQVSIFNYMGAPSYAELYPQESHNESSPSSVIATTPTIIGAIQANEAIKVAIGYGSTLAGKLLTMDSRNYTFNIFSL